MSPPTCQLLTAVAQRSASNDHGEVYRLPVTPATATYGASVTTTIRRWVIALLITLASLALIAVISVNLLMMGEEICEDRSPWWGPPEDPNSTCSGLWWAEKHPGEYPWTMPR